MNARQAGSMVVGIVAAVFWHYATLPAQDAPRSETAKDVNSALPGPVAKLASWPADRERAGKVVQFDTFKKTLRAQRNSMEWIQKVVEPQWLPESPVEVLGSKMVLLEDAFDDVDTSHVEWEKNGYSFRVSQTMTIFYLAVTPTHGKIADGDVAAMLKACREISSKVINDIADVKMVLKSGEVGIAAGGTRLVLIRSSFDAAHIKPFDDGIVVQPADIDPKDELERARCDFWWRRMGWWTNGETLGLFTLKSEGGAWKAHYASTLDKEWFSSPRPNGK